MDVMATAFKRFFGKVKKVKKKEVSKGEGFLTPPCLVFPIPSGTVYYEIILEKGATKKTLTIEGTKIVNHDLKLTFFVMRGTTGDLEKEIIVGEKYCFFTQSWQKGYWVSKWGKINELVSNLS